MTDAISIQITGDRDVGLRFDQFPQQIHAKLLGTITSLTERLYGQVRAATPKRTGRLQSEIAQHVYDSEDRIAGVVSVDAEFAKAGALEYGARGRSRITEHSMRLDHVFANRLSGPISVMVEAHSRQMNLVAERFLRGPEGAMAAEAVAELQADVDAVAGAN